MDIIGKIKELYLNGYRFYIKNGVLFLKNGNGCQDILVELKNVRDEVEKIIRKSKMLTIPIKKVTLHELNNMTDIKNMNVLYVDLDKDNVFINFIDEGINTRDLAYLSIFGGVF